MKRFVRTISYGLLKNTIERKTQKRYINTSLVQPRPYLEREWTTAKETIFSHVSFCQQKRGYVPKTNLQKCWNCEKECSNGEVLMQCQYCGILQDVKMDISYFDLLGFPETFDLESQALIKRFRQMQMVVHPDKFSNKSSREQSNSADWSSLVNKAYKTLSIPLERGQYLLKLNGLEISQDNSALDKEFLMKMMERNEEVDDASTKSELNVINERLAQELEEKVKYLAETFSENNLEKAKTLLTEMKYLVSIQKSIKNKMQRLLGS